MGGCGEDYYKVVHLYSALARNYETRAAHRPAMLCPQNLQLLNSEEAAYFFLLCTTSM